MVVPGGPAVVLVPPEVHRSETMLKVGMGQKPTTTFAHAFGGTFGGAMGWVLGVFAATLIIMVLSCGGCLALAILGGSLPNKPEAVETQPYEKRLP